MSHATTTSTFSRVKKAAISVVEPASAVLPWVNGTKVGIAFNVTNGFSDSIWAAAASVL
jgi:hypothetical protein